LVENLQDGMIVLDSQRRVVDFNPAASKLLEEENIKIGQKIDEKNTFLKIPIKPATL
jgi:PAS domain-containing protein